MAYTNSNIQQQVLVLPEKPGVYQYFDKNETIIYIGKAKSLKKRVASYFTKNISGKTAVLVKKIVSLKFIVVETEYDALLLENNLIKKHQPRYNILLKDDKTYPWICIKNERFPRIFYTRNLIKDGSNYYGPYASLKMMNTLLELVKKLFPIRTCSFNLSEKNIEDGKFKLCLDYHIGKCLGPCENLQTIDDYNDNIEQIKSILKGNIVTVKNHLKNMMQQYSEDFAFEKAHLLKEKIELLERYQSKSTVVSPTITNVDVFSITIDDKNGYVNFLKVINGAIVQAHTIELKKQLDETEEDLFAFGITEIRQRFESNAKEILVPFIPDLAIPETHFKVAQRGDKKALLELSQRNCKYYMLEKHKQIANINPERHTERILNQIQTDLRLQVLPVHIECFDNSNIQGTDPVAACVVFKNAKPSKKDYRHFNIKTVVGPDDFASMEEVVYRRYKRLLNEKEPLPQLIVIDGGKGQLSSAVKSLDKLGLRGKIAIIGIAKKLEELFFPGDSVPLYLDKSSETLKVIQQLRNEAHRFGITHHRGKRIKGKLKSELTEVEGIGYNTAQALLRKFKSVKQVKVATLKELEEVISKQRAKFVFEHFREN